MARRYTHEEIEKVLLNRFPHHVEVPDLWENDEWAAQEDNLFRFEHILTAQFGTGFTNSTVEDRPDGYVVQNAKAVWDHVGDTLVFKHAKDAVWAKLRFR